jgi:hypothetical protein
LDVNAAELVIRVLCTCPRDCELAFLTLRIRDLEVGINPPSLFCTERRRWVHGRPILYPPGEGNLSDSEPICFDDLWLKLVTRLGLLLGAWSRLLWFGLGSDRCRLGPRSLLSSIFAIVRSSRRRR